MRPAILKKVKKVFLVLLLVCAAVFLAAVNMEGIKKDKNSEYVVGNMPDYFMNFSMSTMDGETFTQENFSDYRITVINGWGTTCKACVNEMPDLQELSREYADKGLQIVGLLADYYSLEYDESDMEDAADIIEKTGVTYPVLIPDEAYRNKVFPMTNDSLPATWLVNNHGEIVAFISGNNSKEEWAKQFDRYLSLY